MKTSHNNSQLENFLRDTLKNLDVQYQQSDWIIMESMLGPVHKPIDININKKTILISASVLLIAIIGIIISQTVHFDNSSSKEISPQNIDSSHSLLQAIDPQKTTDVVSNPIPPVVDSTKIELPPTVLENKVVDAVKTAASADTASTKKINSAKNISQKTDKKKKQNTVENTSSTDTAALKTVIELPAVDTAAKHPHQEITLSTPADSSKKNKKDKKQKLKFLFRQKKDSLK